MNKSNFLTKYFKNDYYSSYVMRNGVGSNPFPLFFDPQKKFISLSKNFLPFCNKNMRFFERSGLSVPRFLEMRRNVIYFKTFESKLNMKWIVYKQLER